MLLEQHLLQLFGNLPYLPKAEITKHLGELDLIKAFLVSEKWDKAVERRGKNDVARKPITPESRSLFGGISFPLEEVPRFYMTSENDRVEMRVYESDYLKTKPLTIDFPVESALKNSTEIVENDEYGVRVMRVICRSENFEQFENRILATFHKLRTWLHVETCEILVNLDLGFDLEFLKKLRLEKCGNFKLSGDKKDGQIDGEELSDLMGNWKIDGCLRIRIETFGRFEGNLEMLRGFYCEFTDSRWITGDMFVNRFNGERAKFKKCLLTSQDFNRFFKKWIEREKNMMVLECHMEHELDVGEVLEGLRAERWDPRRRERMHRDSYAETDILTDLADGMDISSHGELATIHISADKKVIKFFWWYNYKFIN